MGRSGTHQAAVAVGGGKRIFWDATFKLYCVPGRNLQNWLRPWTQPTHLGASQEATSGVRLDNPDFSVMISGIFQDDAFDI